jgi:malonyl CoA-acyl carrier protein transacylase
MLGYSMGLITALVCGRAVSFAAGLHLLKTIYEYPRPYAEQNQGMGVIIGKSCREAAQIIAGNILENEVYIASINSDSCIVISGLKESVKRILQIAGQSGAIKAALIKSPYAFHSPLAACGIERLVKLVEETPVGDSEIPLLSVFTQNILQEAPDLKRELVLNMTSSMKWKESIIRLASLGTDGFVEVSPADELTRMSRVINLDYEFFTHKKIKRLQNS